MADPTTSFRFVHTADLHLDSPLTSLALRDAALAERIDGATRTALRRTVDLCIEERVDALLIAGDLYDGNQKSMHTAAVLTAEMRRLGDAGIPVFLIRGNHDAESRVTEELMLPDNVHAFDGRGGVRELAGGAVAIHGVSFRGKSAPDSLLPKLKAPRPDALNIGLLHTSLSGGEGRHATYAPCTLGELVDHGYHYWALGHVHKRQVHSEWPAVVMPGNPQGRDIGEDGARSVSLVTLDADGARVEARDVSSARFERVSVSLDAATEWADVPDALERALRESRSGCAAESLITRVELVGRTSLGWRLARDADYLLGTARELAAGLDGVWVEKVSTRTVRADEHGAAEESPDAHGPGESDVLPGVAALIDDDVLASGALIERLERDADALIRKLPADIRDLLGDDEASRHARLRELAREGSERVLARLGEEGREADRGAGRGAARDASRERGRGAPEGESG